MGYTCIYKMPARQLVHLGFLFLLEKAASTIKSPTARWLLAIVILLPVPEIVAAQPYAAAGGFARPQLLGKARTTPDVAVAADGEEVYAYWDDGEGVVRRSLSEPGSPLERIHAGRGIRTVRAVTVAGKAAVAWVQRNIDNGQTHHVLRWQGEDRTVLEALQPYPIVLAAAADGPAVLYSRGQDGDSVLFLYRWDGSLTEIHRSSQTISKFSLIFDQAGNAHVGWLEGFRDRGAVGLGFSKWLSYYARVDADGRVSPARELGPASNIGVQSTTTIALSDSGPLIMWVDDRGIVTIASPDLPPRRLEPGVPLGILAGDAYWIRGTSIRRLQLADAGATAENVIWSPNTPELADAAIHNGVIFLGWYGAASGGGFALYGSSTTAPITLNWKDRLASRMGWNPWNFWAALAGQLLASLFAGIMITMVLTPLFWLASMLISQLGYLRRATEVGIAVSALSLLALLGLIAWRNTLPATANQALFGSPLEIVLALLAGGVLTWLLLRRTDSETQMGILASACLNTAISLSFLSFTHFQAWTQAWSQFI